MGGTPALSSARIEHLPNTLWISLLARAVPALVGALVIAFSQDHSPRFGLVVFGVVLVVSGIMVGFEAVGIPGHPARGFVYARALLSTIAGGVSLFLAADTHELGTAGTFILVVAVWGIVTGLIELIGAYVTRRHHLYSGEILISGALTLLIGVVIAFVPADLLIQLGGIEQVQGTLDASVTAVGLVGGFFTVLGVLLVVESITLRSALRRRSAQHSRAAASPTTVPPVASPATSEEAPR